MAYSDSTHTWRKVLELEMDIYGDSFDSVVHTSIPIDEWNQSRQAYRGFSEDFTLWTDTRVYFPAQLIGSDGAYDGHDIASVPRNPCDEIIEAVGGYR